MFRTKAPKDPAPDVLDLAVLLRIVTSKTEKAQSLQLVLPDDALGLPNPICDLEYDPIMMLIVPPYTCISHDLELKLKRMNNQTIMI